MLELTPRTHYHQGHGLGALTKDEAEAALRDAIRTRIRLQADERAGRATAEDVRVALEAEQSAQRALAEAVSPGVLEQARAQAAAAQATAAPGPGPAAALEVVLPRAVRRWPWWAKLAGAAAVAGAGYFAVTRFLGRRRGGRRRR